MLTYQITESGEYTDRKRGDHMTAVEMQLMQECEFYRMKAAELEKTENAVNQIKDIIENTKQRYGEIMWQKINDVTDLPELYEWKAIDDLQKEIELLGLWPA